MVLRNGLQDRADRIAQIRNDKLGLFSQGLAITVIDENGAAAGGMSAINIPPAIANQEAFLQVDLQCCGRAQKHAGLWFPAFAWFAITGAGVITDFDRIERGNGRAQSGVHRLDDLAALRSAAHIGLVRDDNKKKAGFFQPRARIDRIGIKLEFFNSCGRKRKAVAKHGPIEHAIPVQDDRALSYLVLSHFVCAVLSAECETNKCQTTA